jgi:hypothetical protein
MRGLLNVLVAFLLLFCNVPAAAGGKRAIVTLLSGPPGNAEKYVRLLHFFVYSLRNAGYSKEIVVMHTRDYPINHAKLARLLQVRLVPVEKITIPDNKKNKQYGTMLTKLHIWNLVEYQQVMYYDCDFIFQHNPEPAFDECSWSNLCASVDTGMTQYDRTIEHGTYFNAGFLVIRPSKETYQSLFSKRADAYHRAFVEQDLLNAVYKNSWGKLNQKYNLMHCYMKKKIDEEVVAIHEKMWVLRENFPQKTYIWNSARLQVNYAITDVLVSIGSAPASLRAYYGSEDAGFVANTEIDPTLPKKPLLYASTEQSPMAKGEETNKAMIAWSRRQGAAGAAKLGATGIGTVGSNTGDTSVAAQTRAAKNAYYLRQRDAWIKDPAQSSAMTAAFAPASVTTVVNGYPGSDASAQGRSDVHASTTTKAGKIKLVTDSSSSGGAGAASQGPTSSHRNRIYLVAEPPSAQSQAVSITQSMHTAHENNPQPTYTSTSGHADGGGGGGALQQDQSPQHTRQVYQNGVVRTSVKATGGARARAKRAANRAPARV